MRRIRPLVCLLASLLLACPSAGLAQEIPIWSESGRHAVGRTLPVQPLTVSRDALAGLAVRTAAHRLAAPDARALRQSRRRPGWARRHPVVVGAILGAGVGMGVGVAKSHCGAVVESYCGASVGLYGGLGAGIGAIVGYNVR